MATCNLISTSGTQTDDGDTATYLYQAVLDTVVTNPHEAIAAARTVGLPARRAALGLGTYLFARSFSASRNNEKHLYGWDFSVTFEPPGFGENETHQVANPLERPPVVTVRNNGREYVVKEARNVTALTGGFTRPSGTLGPLVNAAFRRPDEPIVDTENSGVLIVRKNYQSLGSILTLNDTFKRTTNSDTITIDGVEFSARQLKYYVTETDGPTLEDGVLFYPGTTEIEITDTTDLTIDNVGFEYWDPAAGDNGDYVRALDADGNETAEPINLALDGTRLSVAQIGGTAPTTITYRHLAETAYADFFA